MMQYAKVLDGEILDYRDEPPEGDQSALAVGKPRWLPVEVVDPTSFDDTLQAKGGMVETVEDSRVVRSWPVREKNSTEIATMKAEKYDAIEEEFQTAVYAPISYTVSGSEYEFHADRDAIESIMGVVQLILAGVKVPDPRQWTPKGQLTPIDISHAELIGLGAAIALRKDALFTIKKTAQRKLMAMTDAADIAAFDPGEGF